MQRLSDEITASVISKERKRVAVVPFAPSDRTPLELGFYLSDKLMNRLFKSTAGFTVVDRFHLDDAIKEIEMGYAGVQDPQSAQKLGRILGADALVTGTLTKLDKTIDVTLRLVATETTDVLATADARIPRSPTVDRLWDEYRPTGRTPNATSTPSSSTTVAGYAFYEDFKSVPIGEIPDGWKGGENMAMKKAKSGAKCLAFFRSEPAQAPLQTPEIVFPENFDLELSLFFERGFDLCRSVNLGTLEVCFITNAGIHINGVSTGARPPTGVWFSFRVQRTGNVYKFLLDDAEIYVARCPGLVIRNIRFTGYQQHYAINKITVKPLSPETGG